MPDTVPFGVSAKDLPLIPMTDGFRGAHANSLPGRTGHDPFP